ncbi:MAG: hypothetical protein GY832_27855 [Chloroflexi bacterium]|nr:hypothetical protein [Chloroflexota bacterium]
MDHIKILQRAWETTWRYRALWIFGIILALTTASGGSSGGSGSSGPSNSNGTYPPSDFPWSEWTYTWDDNIPPQVVNILIVAGIGVTCVILFMVIAGTIARYVSETALIRMVDDHEETGEQRSIREGFRLGWSRTTLQLFLINLLISLPTIMIFIMLFALTAAPMLLWITGSTPARIIGVVATVGLFFLILFLAIVVGTVFDLLKKFFWRACALENLGVLDSIREGFNMVRHHLKDVGIMWLIMIGVRIGWAITMIVTFIVLLPVTLLLVLVGGVLGGLPALLIGGLVGLFIQGPVPWIIGGLIGLPIFILILAAPWLFLSGLMETFKSSTWTLTYRELRVLDELEPEPAIEAELKMGEWDELDEPDLDLLPDNS